MGAVTPRLCASGDIFNHRGRKPWASVNFITAHDGFTLNDLVSYNDRHNEANGEDNRDGHANNRSWNCGAEGPTDDPGVNTLRERQMRNLLATLLLSQGTPMLVAGDEFARTQQGNNNAYCQDNEISWVDWGRQKNGRTLIRFMQRLTKLRRDIPTLRRTRFLTGKQNGELGVKDVTWLNASGGEMRDEDWSNQGNRCFGMLIDGRAQPTGIRQRGGDPTVLLVFNAHHDVVPFTLPQHAGGNQWVRLVDTNLQDNEESWEFKSGDTYLATARSLLVFALKATNS